MPEFKLGDIVKFKDETDDYYGVVIKDFGPRSNVVGISWDSNSGDRVDNYKRCVRHATEDEIKRRLINILKA